MAYSSVSDEVVEEFNPKKEEKEGSILEVGDQAVWSLSSCKAGMKLIIDILYCLNQLVNLMFYKVSELTSSVMTVQTHIGKVTVSYHTW
jgi:hypothetical protein